MSTIASPRPSMSLSSRRTSTSTDTTTRSASTSRPAALAAGALRRNRTALRDYYGLKTAAGADASADEPSTPTLDAEQDSELDKPDFNADDYVQSLLAKEGLEGVLRVEAGLIREIRSLDGEKKALVYDNYSKLIAATDTIRSMREKMDPLTPTTSTLSPAIGHIAETAATLSTELRKYHGVVGDTLTEEAKKQEGQQRTVRWVLDAPQRLRDKMSRGCRDEAEAEWKQVCGLLDRWSGVRGVEDVRQACVQALGERECEHR